MKVGGALGEHGANGGDGGVRGCWSPPRSLGEVGGEIVEEVEVVGGSWATDEEDGGGGAQASRRAPAGQKRPDGRLAPAGHHRRMCSSMLMLAPRRDLGLGK